MAINARMNSKASFIIKDEGRQGVWKFVAKSDKLIENYVGKAFGDSKIDDGSRCIEIIVIFH